MTIKASEIFAEYGSEANIYNLSLEELGAPWKGVSTALDLPVGLIWETVDDDGFLGTWQWLKEPYYNGYSISYLMDGYDLDDTFYQQRVPAYETNDYGHAFVRWSWTGWTNDFVTVAPDVAMYFPQDGRGIEPPVFEASSLSEESSEIKITLDSAEAAAIITAYNTETGLISATIEANIIEKASKISLLTIDVAHTFKKISPLNLKDTLSAFKSGEEEATEGISISTTKSGY